MAEPSEVQPCAVPVYLTADQVGELLQLSPKTVYRLVKADPTMPALKLGGTLRFPRERLERWLRSREQGQPMGRQVRLVTKSAGSAAAPAPCADRCADGRGDRPA